MVRAAASTEARCVGVEIDETRGNEAADSIKAAGLSREKCDIVIGNALEQDYSSATMFFLYLIPRGLRIILPYIKNLGKKVKVVTYMSPFPDEVVPVQVVKVTTAVHDGADWPLWVYEIGEKYCP